MKGTSDKAEVPRMPAVALIYISLAVPLLVLHCDGGVSPATFISSTAILLIGCLWQSRMPQTVSKPGVIVGLLLLLCFLTTLSLPEPLLRAAGHQTAEDNAIARYTLDHAHWEGIVQHEPGWMQISRNRAGTLRALLLLTAALCIGNLARRIPLDHRIYFLAGLGVAGALVGIAGLISLHMAPQEKTFWWILQVPHGRPVTCFTNRNHFAGFLGVIAAMLFGITCRLFGSRKLVVGHIAAAAFLVCSLSVLSSLSRGALAAFVLGLALAIALHIRKHWITVVALVIILLAGSAAMLTVGPGRNALKERVSTMTRPADMRSLELRVGTWKDCARIFKSYPVFGTGLNAFRAVYPQHRTTVERKEADNLENEYLQLPVELGLLGTALLAAAVILFIVPLVKTRNFPPSLRSAILPGLLVAAAHNFIDFPIRIPLYACSLAILFAFCLRPSHCTAKHDRRPLAGLLILGTVVLAVVASDRTAAFSFDSHDYMNVCSAEDAARAIESSPTFWHAYYSLGRSAAASPAQRKAAERYISTASELNPRNYNLLIRLALLRRDMGLDQEAADAYRQAKELRNWLNVPELEPLLNESKNP